jgi:putative membrane protein
VIAEVGVSTDPWRFQAHPQVWLLVGFLAAAYIYVVRVLGPKAVAPGQVVVTRRQVACAVGAMALLWFASDWPVHDLAEEYLYSAHMLQHMVLAYFIPPLALLGTPEWFARVLIGRGRAWSMVRWLSKPVIAGVVFNAVVMITHIPGLVNRSAESSPLHYGLHVLLVTSSMLMWLPVCGPFAELRMGYGARMIYLFLQSVVPTVPAGWLTFAEGAVYKHYDVPVRVFGLSVTYDQQIAGLIMKIGGGMYLWAIVIFLFFGRFAAKFGDENSYRRATTQPMTYEAVADAFDRSEPPNDPMRTTAP